MKSLLDHMSYGGIYGVQHRCKIPISQAVQTASSMFIALGIGQSRIRMVY